MRHPATNIILALLLTVIALPGAAPAPAGAAGPLLAASPASLAATVELGATATLDLLISNPGPVSATPQLYAGLAPAPGAALRARARAPLPLPPQAARLEPQLAAQLSAGPAAFLVYLADRPDLGAAYAIDDWAARGAYVYRTLTEHAARSQRAIRAQLDAAGAPYQVLWVVNALRVEGDAALATALAARADVALLSADHQLARGDPPAAQTAAISCDASADSACWNIARIGADRVWREFGVSGAGITVATIDSGVDRSHPALAGQYRGALAGGGVSHDYNWYDPAFGTQEPDDAGSHGTHVMGSILAAPLGGPAMGVAPGARWIAARGCGIYSCLQSDLISAAQWMLAPTDMAGGSPRSDLRPHIINNSWSVQEGNEPFYAGYTAAWQAAGIFTVFAAGNMTSNLLGCGSIASPGDYADLVGVGATGSDDRLATFSRIGPAADGRTKPDLVPPGYDITSTLPGNSYGSLSGTSMAAPHVAGAVALLWSANPQLIGDYAATYALLTGSARPRTGDARYTGGAHQACQPSGVPNDIYGYGQLDAYAAVAAAQPQVAWLGLPPTPLASIAGGQSATVSVTLDARRVPGPGVYQARVLVHGADLGQPPQIVPVTLTVPARPSHAAVVGTLRRAENDTAISGMVTVAGGAQVATAADGSYRLTLPGGVAQRIEAAAVGYAPRSSEITPTAGLTTTLDFRLPRDQPGLSVLSGSFDLSVDFGQAVAFSVPLRNDGTRPLSYSLEIGFEPYGVWRSDEPGGPPSTWSEPPPGARTLLLGDDDASGPIDLGFSFAIGGERYEQAYVGSNGMISFSPVAPGQAFVPGCLPLAEAAGPALVPLHIDFDPSQGGRVSYAATAEGLLVTWDDVPLYRLPEQAERRLSVQALLRPDGSSSLRYRAVAAIGAGDYPAYGVQQTAGAQIVGCPPLGGQPATDLVDGLTIELRPQPNAQSWLSPGATSGTLAAGASGGPQLSADWIGTVSGVAQARLRLRSNDPDRPEAIVRVRLSAGAPPPHQLRLLLIWR